LPPPRESRADEFVLRGNISRRLSLIFGTLFLAVILVGGISLYLARSIFLSTQEIGMETDRIDIVDRIHSTFHHFVSAIQRAQLRGVLLLDSERSLYLGELDALTQRYIEGGKGGEFVAEVRQMVSGLAVLSERMTQRDGARLQSRDIKVLDHAEQTIRALAHRVSAAHRSKMEKLVQESRWKMRMILGSYGAFLIGGGLLILASSFFFSVTIARPLGGLAQAAADVSQGNLHRQVPVTSKDEIGQLSHAFNVMTDRLKEHEERLKGLAALEERERIAQELHDSLAQDLGLLRLKVIELEETLAPSDRQAVTEILEDMRKVVDSGYEDVRQAIFGLRTMVARGLGLVPTLTEYLHDFSEARKIPVDFKIHGAEDVRFSLQTEVQLIRIIHEALTNVFKHAQATRNEVRIERDGEFTRVTVEDNGRGFRPEQVMRNGFHFGIQTMRERAEGVGGSLVIDTAVGRGTTVTVRLPHDRRSYEARSSAASR
jgi:signal transduction histidine kinase